MNVSPEQYQAAIPKHCFYQTVEEHQDCLMLCWGLVASIKEGYEMNCGSCDLIVNERRETMNGNSSLR
jgi:hypothetical protein